MLPAAARRNRLPEAMTLEGVPGLLRIEPEAAVRRTSAGVEIAATSMSPESCWRAMVPVALARVAPLTRCRRAPA